MALSAGARVLAVGQRETPKRLRALTRGWGWDLMRVYTPGRRGRKGEAALSASPDRCQPSDRIAGIAVCVWGNIHVRREFRAWGVEVAAGEILHLALPPIAFCIFGEG